MRIHLDARTSESAAAVRGREITTDGQQVTLIDLHNLPERAQRFVNSRT